VPGLAAVISSTLLAFALGDEHSEYYLCERLALAEWARQHGFALVLLPAVRGSRQTANVKLATAIYDNASVYLTYVDQRCDKSFKHSVCITKFSCGL
jgi:hypothetical protein